MKSKVKNNTSLNLSFPSLMEGTVSGVIVLFTEVGKGVVVGNPTSESEMGYFYNSWDMSAFKNFHGEVVLSN